MQSDLGKDFLLIFPVFSCQSRSAFYFTLPKQSNQNMFIFNLWLHGLDLFRREVPANARFSCELFLLLSFGVVTEARRHQIRLHLAAAGFPVLGDDTYGGSRCET